VPIYFGNVVPNVSCLELRDKLESYPDKILDALTDLGLFIIFFLISSYIFENEYFLGGATGTGIL